MRKTPGLTLVGLVVALTLVLSGAVATTGSSAASACANETVNGGKYVGQLNLRFVLIRSVSCDEAHRLIRAFFSHAATGPCEGTLCLTQFPSSWTCGYFFATESNETGGALAGCYQTTTGARIRVYKASRVMAPHGAVVFSPLAYGISCYMTRDWVFCWIGSSVPPTHHAKLGRNGKFSVTATVPIPLGLGGRDTAFGAHRDFGRFRCQSLRSGMKCTVIATGKGFRINRHETVHVG
jgi:hypothetical protein